MSYKVLLKPANGKFIAQVLGLPECFAEGPTREETIENVKIAIAKALEGTELLTIETATPPIRGGEDPWMKSRGMFCHDSDYEEVLREIKAYRKQVDVECPSE
jgi:predicted RNase H-like HicB family nuclease